MWGPDRAQIGHIRAGEAPDGENLMAMSRSNVFARFASWPTRPSEADRAAGLELAVSARRFSRRTQAVVDDKLSFSATLMRAGEVEAAQRLLAEVEREVLDEEAALIERVNEVKFARSIERDKMTRGRLARTLAVAMLGSSLLAFSVAGAAVVGLFKDDKAIHGSDPDANDGALVAGSRGPKLGTRDVRVLDNVSLAMTNAQFRRFTKLTSGDIDGLDERQLELFLMGLLPPALAEKIHYALVSGLDTLPDPVADDVVAASHEIEQVRASASRPADEDNGTTAGDDPGEADETPEPTPEPSDTEPSDDPTPSPNESPEDETHLPIFDDDGEG